MYNYSYRFIYKTFDGNEHVHVERFEEPLSDERLSKVLDKIMAKYGNVKSVYLDRVFRTRSETVSGILKVKKIEVKSDPILKSLDELQKLIERLK